MSRTILLTFLAMLAIGSTIAIADKLSDFQEAVKNRAARASRIAITNLRASRNKRLSTSGVMVAEARFRAEARVLRASSKMRSRRPNETSMRRKTIRIKPTGSEVSRGCPIPRNVRLRTSTRKHPTISMQRTSGSSKRTKISRRAANSPATRSTTLRSASTIAGP